MISVFFHNYYGQHKEWMQLLAGKMAAPFNLYYHIVEDSIHNIREAETIHEAKPSQIKNLVVRHSPNRGKDIGGKLVLIDAWLRLNEETDLIIFLHDKKSPHAIHNKEWQQKLFRIIDPSFVQNALAAFESDSTLGIAATEESIQNEYDASQQSFVGNNKIYIDPLRNEYGFKHTDQRHVAGTMFWARALPLVNFFKQHAALDIRATLEPGNVMDETQGTRTHAWERMLSWLITEQGYHLKGF